MDRETTNFAELLRLRAQQQPERIAYTFLGTGAAPDSITYWELDRRARQVAACLRIRNVAGKPVLLLFPTGLDYIAALFGCFYAGALATPVYVPRINRKLERIRSIALDSGATVAVTTSSIVKGLQPVAATVTELSQLGWVAVDTVAEGNDIEWQAPAIGPETLAILQYTSGSTGTPKGVMLNHRNLLYNSAMLQRAFRYSSDSRCVSWLPLFHDMGLIGGILQPMYGGFPCALLDPMSFMQRPVRWLQAIYDCGATISGGPNFGYDLCVRKIKREDLSGLDLRAWEVAFTGAETVRAATLDRFAQMFEVCGFRKRSFVPCYGLAEATLLVSARDVERPLEPARFDSATLEQKRAVRIPGVSINGATGRTLISSGVAAAGQTVIIVDPESSTRTPAGHVGEIWVAGPNVAHGYWNRPDETQTTFHAMLGNDSSTQYLRTGDLGFTVGDELFIAGRLKDLLIIRGRNHYPQDIEQTVEACHPSLRPGCGAATSAEVDGEERLVIVHEVDQSPELDIDQVAATVRKAVVENHDLSVYALALIKPGTLPRTTSGKVRRHACAERFLGGGLALVGASVLDAAREDDGPPAARRDHLIALPLAERDAALREYIKAIVCAAGGVDPATVSAADEIVACGLDSLAGIQIKTRLESEFLIELPIGVIFQERATILGLANAIADRLERPETGTGPQLAARRSSGPVRASIEQERFWLLDQVASAGNAYNLTAAYRIRGALDISLLERSVRETVRRHEALRSSFSESTGEIFVTVAVDVDISVALTNLEPYAPLERDVQVRALAQQDNHQRFELSQRSLMRLRLVRLTQTEHILLLTTHHIVSDVRSFSIFISDLAAIYQALASGMEPSLPRIDVPYTDFAFSQRLRLQEPDHLEHVEYWRNRLAGGINLFPRSTGQEDHTGVEEFELPADLLDRLKPVQRQCGVTPFMFLLATFQLLLSRLTGQSDIRVAAPVSGRYRPETDLPIGLFAHPVVFRTDLSGNPAFTELLSRVRTVALEAYAHQELPFSKVLQETRCMRTQESSVPAQVLFNVVTRPPALDASTVCMQLEDVSSGRQAFDLVLTLAENARIFRGKVAYNPDLFDAASMRAFVNSYKRIIEDALTAPGAAVAELAVDPALPNRALDRHSRQPAEQTIVIAATFTADPLAEPLGFWMSELQIPSSIQVAPLGQVFQQLLDRGSILGVNRRGANVVLLRIQDWQKEVSGAKGNVTDEIAQALETFTHRSAAPCVAVICPGSGYGQAERELASALKMISSLDLIEPSELIEAVAPQAWYDEYSDELATIPYTPTLFAALAAAIARRIHGRITLPYKVLALDCDETLWGGVCGEDGPYGVQIDERRIALQEFAVEQHRRGMLLCLCSRNNEEDVFQVFDAHPEMPLRREHLVSWRINWGPKSANLKALAEELRLGLDSFILVDDSAVERSEVRTNCPEVLVLQPPVAPEDPVRFLKNSWAFERSGSTQEDQHRTDLYRHEASRSRLKIESPTLAGFIEALQVKVTITTAASEQMPRISQLTYRTNQFNCSARRLSEGDLDRLTSSEDHVCLAVQVSDRFGDYGLVGVILLRRAGDSLQAPVFLLSCRALGRGVEYKMLAHIGALAQEQGLAAVDVLYERTPKNAPARQFLQACLTLLVAPQETGGFYRYSSEAASVVLWDPSYTDAGQATAMDSPERAGDQIIRMESVQRADLHMRIATELANPHEVARLVDARRTGAVPVSTIAVFVAPSTPTEEQLAAIWSEMLGVTRIGVRDNFFDLGGHSLLAIRIQSRIRDVFGVSLPLSILFDRPPTVAELASVIDDAVIREASAEDISAALDDLGELSEDELRALLAPR